MNATKDSPQYIKDNNGNVYEKQTRTREHKVVANIVEREGISNIIETLVKFNGFNPTLPVAINKYTSNLNLVVFTQVEYFYVNKYAGKPYSESIIDNYEVEPLKPNPDYRDWLVDDYLDDIKQQATKAYQHKDKLNKQPEVNPELLFFKRADIDL